MNIDNQQEKDSFEAGWISGIIDGEGWLILNEQKTLKGTSRYVPVVGMNSTSVLLADELERILRKNNIGVWRGIRNFKNPNHKRQYVVNIRGLLRVKKFLEVFGKILLLKKEQGKLLDEFINYRLSRPNKESCTEVDAAFRQRLQKLNE